MRPALFPTFLLTLLSFSAVAQEKTQRLDPGTDELRRLESVTWDLKTHTLRWTVQKGTEINGDFVVSSSDSYEITPDVATMKVAGEKRGFDPDEAALLHRLLDTISVYCAQSVAWWDRGEGVRLTDSSDRNSAPPSDAAKPVPKEDKPAVKPSTLPVKQLPLGVAELAAPPVRPAR